MYAYFYSRSEERKNPNILALGTAPIVRSYARMAQTRRETSSNSKSSVRGMESSDSSVSEYSEGSGSSARVVRKSNSPSRRVGAARAATLRRFRSTRVQSALWTVRRPLRFNDRPISECETSWIGTLTTGFLHLHTIRQFSLSGRGNSQHSHHDRERRR